jgi:beta-carotene 3-hydroxylase
MLRWTVLFLASFAGMELVAYLTHKYVMHGFLWVVHESHHRTRHGAFEWNDLFGVIFALPAIAFIYLGTHGQPTLLPIGLGITTYGAVYFGFHDVLVHRRIPHHWIPKRGYLRRLVRAHLIHHRTRTRDGAESFGFLYAPEFGPRGERLVRSVETEEERRS